MSNHTVQSYLTRSSTHELIAFLWQCVRLYQWDQYEHVIPQIMEILEKRSDTIPKSVLESWAMHRQNRECDNKPSEHP